MGRRCAKQYLFFVCLFFNVKFYTKFNNISIENEKSVTDARENFRIKQILYTAKERGAGNVLDHTNSDYT